MSKKEKSNRETFKETVIHIILCEQRLAITNAICKQQNKLYCIMSFPDFSVALNEFSEFIVCPMSCSKLANYIFPRVEIDSPNCLNAHTMQIQHK